MYYPSKEQFLELSRKGNLIPIYREILGDLETPVTAYLKIAKDAKYSFLLESVEGEEKVARYSFLAKDPELVFESKGRNARIIHFTNGHEKGGELKVVDTPLSFIREIMSQYKPVAVAGLPPFYGGMVGTMGYDVVRFFERLPQKTKDDLKLPDMVMLLSKNLIIFDHLNHKIKIVACAHIDSKTSERQRLKAYDQAVEKIDQLLLELNTPLSIDHENKEAIKTFKIKSNFTKEKFEEIVQKGKQHIKIGDIIQVVLSQRFEVKIRTSALNIYRALRALNPSPYMYFLKMDDVHIAGSSPELLIRVENGVVETRPIAGTRRRGKDDAEDQALAQELLADPKEKAEHIMLVDLGRNDLGRVCERGTVSVSEFMAVEKYSHVMHLVSNVKGHLRKDRTIYDVLAASFPAGTVSGAPKIRAMEIIEDLEHVTRGPYAGAIGYFSFSGNLDTCITIRTIVVKNGVAYTQAGAGIVADSDPQKEYMETINKAKAQIAAIELADKLT